MSSSRRAIRRALSASLFAFCFISSAVARSTWANLFATVNSSGGLLPFPTDFHATAAIAIYDTNHNGFIDSTSGDSSQPFPVSFSGTGLSQPGRWIGSPQRVPMQGSTQQQLIDLAIQAKFCGDVLIYAEQQVPGVPQVFIWLVLVDPAQLPKPAPCASGTNLDYGVGSYEGTVFNPVNIRHAAFFSGAQAGVQSSEIQISFGNPGAMSSPGHVFTRSPVPHRWVAEFVGFGIRCQ